MNRLAEIFENKRREVAEAKARVPLAALREEAASAEPPRGFLSSLQSSGKPLALVAEVKKASPSRGVIRQEFDPAAVAIAYQRAGATALSVLTDNRYFEGSEETLRLVKSKVALPCLRKDFIDDPYQVFQARAWGADAILLILASIEDGLARDLMALSEGLGMDTLVEVHTEEEAERALGLNSKLIGVNNRSLEDFTTNLATGEYLLPMLSSAFRVAESALATPRDLERMRAAGADAVLIGSAFCAADDIESKVREVMNW